MPWPTVISSPAASGSTWGHRRGYGDRSPATAAQVQQRGPPMGTMRMGTDRATSVVNVDGLSHAHPNLWVVGSSVFPTGGTANPSLTLAVPVGADKSSVLITALITVFGRTRQSSRCLHADR
ncbi:GMC oxidoreductase [Saccharopolyspora spinosa]|uniref:GMC oxidoreductase n=1 Tax=Saccharopolyspora spinosa TaxID=60894 RepID=UPI00374990BB